MYLILMLVMIAAAAGLLFAPTPWSPSVSGCPWPGAVIALMAVTLWLATRPRVAHWLRRIWRGLAATGLAWAVWDLLTAGWARGIPLTIMLFIVWPLLFLLESCTRIAAHDAYTGQKLSVWLACASLAWSAWGWGTFVIHSGDRQLVLQRNRRTYHRWNHDCDEARQLPTMAARATAARTLPAPPPDWPVGSSCAVLAAEVAAFEATRACPYVVPKDACRCGEVDTSTPDASSRQGYCSHMQGELPKLVY